MTRPTDTKPRTVADLARVTGLCKRAVYAAIRAGELPGYQVGRAYVVPADAFDAFCEGRWEPKPRPMFREPVKPLALIHRKAS